MTKNEEQEQDGLEKSAGIQGTWLPKLGGGVAISSVFLSHAIRLNVRSPTSVSSLLNGTSTIYLRILKTFSLLIVALSGCTREATRRCLAFFPIKRKRVQSVAADAVNFSLLLLSIVVGLLHTSQASTSQVASMPQTQLAYYTEHSVMLGLLSQTFLPIFRYPRAWGDTSGTLLCPISNFVYAAFLGLVSSSSSYLYDFWTTSSYFENFSRGLIPWVEGRGGVEVDSSSVPATEGPLTKKQEALNRVFGERVIRGIDTGVEHNKLIPQLHSLLFKLSLAVALTQFYALLRTLRISNLVFFSTIFWKYRSNSSQKGITGAPQVDVDSDDSTLAGVAACFAVLSLVVLTPLRCTH